MRPYLIGSSRYPGLIKLMEESAEVTGACAKLMAHDGTDEESECRSHLENEIGDALAAIELVVSLNGLDKQRINRRRKDKGNLYTARHNQRAGIKSKKGGKK